MQEKGHSQVNRCQEFDSRKTRYSIRKRVTRYTGVLMATAVFALATTCMVTYSLPDLPAWAIVLDIMWLGPIGYFGYRISQLNTAVWCVKVYPDRIEGYDYIRRKTTIAWTDIETADFAGEQVALSGEEGQYIRISSAFPYFSEVGEQILNHALRADASLAIEGKDFSSIDMQYEFPYLREVTQVRS